MKVVIVGLSMVILAWGRRTGYPIQVAALGLGVGGILIAIAVIRNTGTLADLCGFPGLFLAIASLISLVMHAEAVRKKKRDQGDD